MSSLEITLQGASSSRTRSTHRRITLAAWLMAAFFMVVAGRLIQLALVDTDASNKAADADLALQELGAD